MLLEIETAIAAKIAQILQDRATVRAFPEKLEKVGQPTRKSQVLVGYKRASFTQQTGHPMALNMTAEFEVSLEMVSLRSHAGMLPILDAIRFGLIGFVPICGNGRLFPSSEAFVNLDENSVWYYSQTYSIQLRILEGMSYYSADNPDGTYYHPVEINLPDPYTPVQIIAGVRRSRDGNLQDNVLDRPVTVNVPGG